MRVKGRQWQDKARISDWFTLKAGSEVPFGLGIVL